MFYVNIPGVKGRRIAMDAAAGGFAGSRVRGFAVRAHALALRWVRTERLQQLLHGGRHDVGDGRGGLEAAHE